MKCRFCNSQLDQVFLDLGSAPPSNAFLTERNLASPELYFPLKLFTCGGCRLVQVDEIQSHDALFDDDYVYFSSFSRSWLAHAERFADAAIKVATLDTNSLVLEVASNDGYLLQYFAARGIPSVGIEPTASTARVAREKGIETIQRFFGRTFALEFVASQGKADLIVGNNVLAHVPDINDFVAGFAAALADGGCISVEFPHLMELVANRQFDTVYHEHFSYLSLHTVRAIFAAHELDVWNVEQLTTHGGSLRVWASHCGARPIDQSVTAMLNEEQHRGLLEDNYYASFQEAANEVKDEFVNFLIEQKRAGQVVAAYGAAAKGNTLINYAGVRSDLISFVVDASPHKQGRWLPGSRIPVVNEDRLRAERPDVIVILPWNLRDEITEQLSYVREWGCRFATFVPSVRID